MQNIPAHYQLSNLTNKHAGFSSCVHACSENLIGSFQSGARDHANAEIVHFYAEKWQKMQHQNFNASQDARC